MRLKKTISKKRRLKPNNFRNVWYVFRQYIIKYLKHNFAVIEDIKTKQYRNIYVETNVGICNVTIPVLYKYCFMVICTFKDPFKAIQIDDRVDIKTGELIFAVSAPSNESSPYLALKFFMDEFEKFLVDGQGAVRTYAKKLINKQKPLLHFEEIDEEGNHIYSIILKDNIFTEKLYYKFEEQYVNKKEIKEGTSSMDVSYVFIFKNELVG